MRVLFLLILMATLPGLGQSTYRMFLKVGGYSVMYGGLNKLNTTLDASVEVDGVTENMLFQTEEYEIDYEDFQFSQGINGSIGINIAEGKRFKLSINGMFGYGTFNSKTYVTRLNEGDNTVLGNSQNDIDKIRVEEESTVYHEGTELMYGGKLQFMFKNDVLDIGPFLGTYRHSRARELPSSAVNYVPYGVGRMKHESATTQIYLGVNLEKRWDWFSVYFSVSQALLTAEGDANRGLTNRPGEIKIIPTGHNLDYRFPTLFELGINFSLAPIRNGCGTCPNW